MDDSLVSYTPEVDTPGILTGTPGILTPGTLTGTPGILETTLESPVRLETRGTLDQKTSAPALDPYTSTRTLNPALDPYTSTRTLTGTTPGTDISASETPVILETRGTLDQETRSGTEQLARITKPKEPSRARSRLGCTQCKKKRIKCDEHKPHCFNCQSKGYNCAYKITLSFREDFENQGKSFGREGVWTKTGPTKKTALQLVKDSRKTHYLDIHNPDQLKFVNFFYSAFTNRLSRPQPALQPSIIPPDIANVSGYDRSSLNFALNYYVDFISPIFNPVEASSSHVGNSSMARYQLSRSTVIEKGLSLPSLIQYSQANPHVFYLILSLGSMYLSKLNQGSTSQDWLIKSNIFRKKGVSMIGSTLRYLESSTAGGWSAEINNQGASTDLLLSLILLIMHEVADNCNVNWVSYLKLSRTLVSSPHFVPPRSYPEVALFKFALDFLNYQESMGRTACREKNSFFDSYRILGEDADQTLDEDCPQSLISWMGCDKNLVSVISDITDLSLERSNKQITESNYQAICRAVRQRLDSMSLNLKSDEILFDIGGDLENLNQESRVTDSELIIIREDIDAEEFCFLLTCEVKRVATLIYLDCCLLNKTPEDEEIKSAIKYVFKHLKFIILKNDFRWCSTLLWSIFVASVSISIFDEDCEELRYLSLQLLDKLDKISLGNVAQTRDIIMNTWRSRDLSNSDENSFGNLPKSAQPASTGKRGRKQGYLGSFNDWETYVANESYKISLA